MKVRLLMSECGYMEGDIATVVEIKEDPDHTKIYIVFVEGRTSTSGYKPYVAYLENQVEIVSDKIDIDMVLGGE